MANRSTKRHYFNIYENETKCDGYYHPTIENPSLYDMDMFLLKNGNIDEVAYAILGEEPGFNVYDVKILQIIEYNDDGKTKKNKYEYNSMVDNEYLTAFLETRIGEKSSRKTSLDKSDKNYINMRTYLFKQLEENGKYFLDNLGGRKSVLNDFNQYYYAYQSRNNSSEEMVQYDEKKIVVEDLLQSYSVFRNLCKYRANMEKSYQRPINNFKMGTPSSYYYALQKNKKPSKSKVGSPKKIEKSELEKEKEHQKLLMGLVDKYNKENEEFLEPDELLQILGEDISQSERLGKS